MYKHLFGVAVLCCLFSTLAFAQKTDIDWDRTANFSNYHTYAWEQSPRPAKGFWNDRIIDAVNKQLQAKGLAEVGANANPDMWVVYSNSIKDQKQVVGTGYNMGPGWYWGGWGANQVTYNTYVTKTGTMVVELADAKNKQLLWRGSATDTISDNSNRNINNLNKAVSKLFQNYPPKQK